MQAQVESGRNEIWTLENVLGIGSHNTDQVMPFTLATIRKLVGNESLNFYCYAASTRPHHDDRNFSVT